MVPVLRAVGGRTCTQLDSTCFQMRRRLKTIAATMSNAVIQISVWFQQRNLVQSDHRLLYEGVFELYEFDSSKRARDSELWVCLMGWDLLSEPDDYGT